jgi:hypothetical protein
MPPVFPFWFKQRQCKAEVVGDDHTLKITGPNLGEAILHIERGENNRWRAAMRQPADGPEIAAAEAASDSAADAWEAAFELYRIHVIV